MERYEKPHGARWDAETINTAASQYSTTKAFRRDYPSAYAQAHKLKLSDVLDKLKKYIEKEFTDDAIGLAIETVETRVEFILHFGNMWRYLRKVDRLDRLDDLSFHRHDWTPVKIQKVSRQYTSYEIFCYFHPDAKDEAKANKYKIKKHRNFTQI